MKYPIIITGGAQRLGLAMAENLLQQQFEVIVTYRSEKPSIQNLQAAGAMTMFADFSSNDGIQRFIKDISERCQSIRAIIHNASDWLSEQTDSDYAHLMGYMMQVHAQAPYQINMALYDKLIKGADIIHMTDYVQETGSDKHTAYAASKAAMQNLMLSFAKKFAPTVKVNAIAPSLLMFNDGDDEHYRKKALEKSILGICPGAQEAVNAMNFILSSEYVTGQTIHLNGGRHLK